MTQDKPRHENDKGPAGESPGGSGNAQRFRGEMEKDRTDGGFLAVDRGSYSVSEQADQADDARQADARQADSRQGDGRKAAGAGRGAPPERAGRADGRSRWREGQEQGGDFARDRDDGARKGGRWPDEQGKDAPRRKEGPARAGPGDIESPTSVRGASNHTISK
jgi:hypothetical protein